MKVPFIDLTRLDSKIFSEIEERIRGFIRTGQYILGENLSSLEREVAMYYDAKYGVGVNSGTDALFVALRTIGINKGDKVITTPFTFYATVSTIMQCGASPIFVDIREDTLNIDEEQVISKITSYGNEIKAIVVVHLYGNPSNLTRIIEYAKSNGIKVIEDQAQSFGAMHKGRKMWGDIVALSFFPTKILGAFGDAGMLLTNDGNIYEKARRFRVYNQIGRYRYTLPVGINSRLDEIQAIILRIKLKYIKTFLEWRKEKYEYYKNALSDYVKFIEVNEGDEPVWNYCVIMTEKRDKIIKLFEERGIGYSIYYPNPLHLEKPLMELFGYKMGDFPIAERISKKVLAIPFFSEITKKEQDYVIDTIKEAIDS
jgi:dTDP-4-amino-4,6-dideoxygalactose transaminase